MNRPIPPPLTPMTPTTLPAQMRPIPRTRNITTPATDDEEPQPPPPERADPIDYRILGWISAAIPCSDYRHRLSPTLGKRYGHTPPSNVYRIKPNRDYMLDPSNQINDPLNAYSHTHARASPGQTISPQSHPGHPTNVPRLPTTRPRRPTIHKIHSNSPTQHPHAHQPHKNNQRATTSAQEVTSQHTHPPKLPSATGFICNLLLGANYISAKQQPRTQRPRRTTPRLHRHSISPNLIQLCIQTYYNPFHSRRPSRRIPTKNQPRSPCRHIFFNTNPKVDRTSTSLRKTRYQKG
jgi:hypothetical protein